MNNPVTPSKPVDDRRSHAARGFAHAYHEAIITDVLDRARKYAQRPKRRMADVAQQKAACEGDSAKAKGNAIREKIASNARMRTEIAEAMKAEAGVKAHDLTAELAGGIAWTDRARILAPVGENKLQLATLAHECGHVFLHAAGGHGYFLPGHIKEMEAESYAHQAFRAHGMAMPARVTKWGRIYVGNWVESDRAAGYPIDPRAEAYARGTRSPYEPLRLIPRTWHSRMPRAESWRKAPTLRRSPLWNAQVHRAIAPTLHEAGEVAKAVGHGGLLGIVFAQFSLALPSLREWFSGLINQPIVEHSLAYFAMVATAGLIGAYLAVTWRTVRRMPRFH